VLTENNLDEIGAGLEQHLQKSLGHLAKEMG
jgi:hypothetical protein